MLDKKPITKLEFNLSLGNIKICERLFTSFNYNHKAKNSMEFHEYVKHICEEISTDLKKKNEIYLFNEKDFIQSQYYIDDDSYKQEQYFSLKIKYGNTNLIERIFPAYYFHPSVRYNVDVVDIFKKHKKMLGDILSSTNLETRYLNYQL